METPAETIRLLDELKGLGFDDEAFWRVHHWREKTPPKRQSIQGHTDYCRDRDTFTANSRNRLVQRRLELVLDAHNNGGVSSGGSGAFSRLAEEAYAEIPPGTAL